MFDAPEWLPFELSGADVEPTWLRLSEAEYRAASFLDRRLLNPASQLRQAPWPAIPADARCDATWIFHIGNVGSTLISRMLGELPDVFALREPQLLRQLDATADFATLTALLSRTWRPEQRANVKATSFVSELAPQLIPAGSKALFLYAAPRPYLENILAGENSWQTLQSLSGTRLARLKTRCPGLAADPGAMHDGLKAALGWACEMTSLAAAAARLPADSVRWLGFDAFLADPPAHFTAVAAHFGHAGSPAAARAIAEGPLLGRYSKALDYKYSPGLRREILADSRHRNAAAIRDGLHWLGNLASRYPAVAAAIRRAGEMG